MKSATSLNLEEIRKALDALPGKNAETPVSEMSVRELVHHTYGEIVKLRKRGYSVRDVADLLSQMAGRTLSEATVRNSIGMAKRAAKGGSHG